MGAAAARPCPARHHHRFGMAALILARGRRRPSNDDHWGGRTLRPQSGSRASEMPPFTYMIMCEET
jgi:hypothetical protein